MLKKLIEPMLDAVEVRHLHYFAVVAEENNLRRAAMRLFIAQPPLSRQIKQLEERLGVALFARHSKGLTLTDEGAKVLEIIRPLLKMKEATFVRLHDEVRPETKSLRVGFSTAFEQGVFTRLGASLQDQYGSRAHIVRAASPKLAKDVRKGRLDAALVALPLDAPGLAVRESACQEPLVAAVPEEWRIPPGKPLPLNSFSGKHLFWFKREANSAFFDFTKSRFAQAGFEPHFLEEPAEHDVLLASIASGKGMGLLAASFAAIKRDGVVFLELTENDCLYMRMGILTLPGNEGFAEMLLSKLPV